MAAEVYVWAGQVHTVAGLLKRFLRDLPEPVIPWALHDDLARALHGRRGEPAHARTGPRMASKARPRMEPGRRASRTGPHGCAPRELSTHSIRPRRARYLARGASAARARAASTASLLLVYSQCTAGVDAVATSG